MTSRNSTGFRSFTATAVALAANVRVKVDSDGKISVAGATDPWIGTTIAPIAASEVGTVQLRNAPGTTVVTASAAIAAGARLYPTADGKVDDAAGTGNFTGLVALEAATADGDQIEAAPVDLLGFTAAAAQAALTDNSGGTADDTLEDCNNAVTGVDGTGSNAASKADVDARLVSIANNFADVGAKINALRTALVNAGIIKGAA